MSRFALVITGLSLLWGCSSPTPPPLDTDTGTDSSTDARADTNVKAGYRVLVEQSYASSLNAEKTFEVFKTQERFNEVFSQYVHPAEASSPTVDFGQHQVVLISMGTQPSSGYAVTIDSVEDSGNQVIVKATFHKPGNGCAGFAALTTPFLFAEIASQKEILLAETHLVEECSE